MRIVFSPLAERQTEALFDHIAEHGGELRAENYVGRIIAHCRKLEHFPERGTRRDDVLEGLRTMGFDRRVTIAFMVSSEEVLIEGIFYGGQNFEAAFRDDD